MNTNPPKVGDGASLHLYTDVQAHTIIEVSKSGKRAVMQRDRAVLLNGFGSGADDALEFQIGGFCGNTSGHQRYDIKPDPNGEKVKISLRKDGTWRTVGKSSSRVTVGRRIERYDFNF